MNVNSSNNTGGQLVPPPLTPGTNKKMTEALQATFASWEKERHKLNVPKGNELKIFNANNFNVFLAKKYLINMHYDNR